jgi:hypothetical protein
VQILISHPETSCSCTPLPRLIGFLMNRPYGPRSIRLLFINLRIWRKIGSSTCWQAADLCIARRLLYDGNHRGGAGLGVDHEAHQICPRRIPRFITIVP